ncbi:MAG: 1,4-dihydroxy-2-naphthoate polyprenyltransferase [Bacteroidota bacterium]
MKIHTWISALRLRTLPLALSTIGMGSFLAEADSVFNSSIFIWAAITTVLLQILSNLANDYGDSIHGADNEERVGPERAVQSGVISSKEMKYGIILFAILSFVSGNVLLYVSVGIGTKLFFWFLGFGILSIIAAYTYTAGKAPYGYAGLGDLMVLIFFGILGVGGSYFLYAKSIPSEVFLPALAMGALATGVLNINNLRDADSDRNAGKNTIPVRFGVGFAKAYHWILILAAIMLSAVYVFLRDITMIRLVSLVGLPLLFLNGYKVSSTKEKKDLDPYLKQLAISTFIFMLAFGLAIIL